MKQTICKDCGKLISNNSIQKHIGSKQCAKAQLGKVKFEMPNFVLKVDDNFFCTICSKTYSKHGIGSHVWNVHTEIGKEFNINKVNNKVGKVNWNKGKTKETDERILKASLKWKEKFNKGEITVKGCCTTEWNNSEYGKECSSRGGGFREKSGRSKKFKVTDSFGNILHLQSSYEFLCMNVLNNMNIKWERPKALKYIINGETKNYFGDFYLIDYGIILDPKNTFKFKCDKEKILLVNQQNKNIVFVLLKEQITEDYIRSII